MDAEGATVYNGDLGEMKYWTYAQDYVKIADFLISVNQVGIVLK